MAAHHGKTGSSGSGRWDWNYGLIFMKGKQNIEGQFSLLAEQYRSFYGRILFGGI
jgi:hypothetical protein